MISLVLVYIKHRQIRPVNEDEMRRLGISPESVAEMHVNDPQGFQRLAGSMALFSLGHEKYFDIKDQMEGRDIERGKLAETIRSNQAGEALQARGQDISRANALTSAYAPTAAMQNYNQYAQMLKADPEGAAAFAAAAGINTNAKKLMSVRENDDGTVTKYYTDGSEEQGKLNQPISGDGFRPIALPTAQKIMEKSPEGAKKAAGFAYRVRDALDSIDTLKDQLSPQRVAIINNALGNGTLANLTLSPTEQQYVVNANDAIMAILRQESRPGKSQDRAAVKVLQQFKDDITSGPNDLRLARENRTDLRKRFMASSDTVDKDTLQKASDIIYKAYTADMKKAVAKNLGADEAINMARVDRSWSKFNDMMGRTRVQKAIASGKATPEDVTKLVFSQSPSERSQLYRLLDDNGRQNARAAIVQNAVDKATDPSGNISVEKFINALHRNRKQSATFFKGVHGKELDGVIKYLNDTRHAAKANVQNLNGQQLYGLLVGGGIINAAVLAGMLKTAAFVVPAAGAVGGAAKAYESPVIRNALLRLANTPKGSTAYDRAISTVTQSLTTAAQASQKEAQ